MDLITKLQNANLIKYGNFTLKSGKQSDIYFDFKGLTNHPKLVYEICQELCKFIHSIDNFVAGVPLGAISYATLVSHITNIPMVLIREEKKTYGTCKLVEGYTENKNIILIEDVITTGTSVINTLKKLEENNIKVDKIICILDRNEGGKDNIIKYGYKVETLLTINDGKIIYCDNS